MIIKEEDWKRGVLFACIMIYKNSLDDSNNSITIEILKNAGIIKKEIKPILEAYEEDEIIVFLYDLMMKEIL